MRINESYKDSLKKPRFEIFENSIKVTLPVISKVLDELSEDELLVYGQLSKAIPKSIGVISKSMPFGKSKTTSLLKRLCDKDFVSITGTGKATRYKSKY